MKMRMKDDVRSATRRPANSLGIAPSLVADSDSKFNCAGFEEEPFRTGRVDSVFGRIELDLVLETCACSVAVNYQCRRYDTIVDDALGSQHDCDICFRGGRFNSRPRLFEKCGIRRVYLLAHAAITWNEAFG